MPEPEQVQPFNPVLVAPDGRPARLPADARCPRCGAGANERVLSAGFGEAHNICQRCAFEFQE